MLKLIRKPISFILRSMSTMSTQRYFKNLKLHQNFEEDTFVINNDDVKQYLERVITKIENSYPPVEENGGEGLYLGTAGVAYMFYHLSKTPTLNEKRDLYLNKALRYLKPALAIASSNKNKQDIPSFILGNSGIHAVASAIYKALGDENQSCHFRQLYYKAANICKDPHFLSCGSDELFVGRAGYILGAIWLSKETGVQIEQDIIDDLLKAMITTGREYARKRNMPCPLMYHYYKVEYLGAAHGLSSILQALLSVPSYLKKNPKDLRDVQSSLEYLLSIQTADGNFPATTDEIGYPCELVHWCHGAAGLVYLMAKAYLIFKQDKYLQSCKNMADLVWEKGLLKKGPGICHGVAGNGYVFLLLYRLTKDSKYIYRANEFYKFMNTDQFKNGARIPDYPYSLYEGLAGTACYLADLTAVEQASFPFSDVFYDP